MLDYIIGKEIKILPGELIAHIRAGRLHPVDEFLRPILPPAVTSTAERLKYLKNKLEENRRLLPLEEGKSKPCLNQHLYCMTWKNYKNAMPLVISR